MKKNVIKTIASAFVIGTFVFLGYGSDESSSKEDKIMVEDLESIKTFIKGKWSHHYMDTYYRFLITDDKITVWTKYANWDWKEEPDDCWEYEITEVRRTDRGDKYRAIQVIEGSERSSILNYQNSMFIDNCLEHMTQCMVREW